MLLIAFAAVYRPGPIRLERYLCLLAAFGTCNICHFSGTAVVATSAATAVFIFSLKHLIHLPFESIQGIETAPKTSQQITLNRRIQHRLKDLSAYILAGQKIAFFSPFSYLLLVIIESISLSLSSCSSPTDWPGNLALLPQTRA